MKVISVTLNPVLEHTLPVNYLAVGYHNLTTQTTRVEPAGRGINIARALTALEIPTEAIVLLGNDAMGKAFQLLLREEHLNAQTMMCSGQTRHNVVIWDAGNKNETTITDDNEGFSDDEVQQVLDHVRTIITPNDMVAFGGPLPRHIEDDFYVRFIDMVHEMEGKVLLDIPKEALKVAIQAKPEFIFMTQNETEGYFNFPVRTEIGLAYCARKYMEEGAQNVLILMNDDRGALFANADITLVAEFPDNLYEGTHSGTIGALLAGWIASEVQGLSPTEAFQHSCAAALFTIAQVGNAFPLPTQLKQHLEPVNVRELLPTQ